MPKALRAALTAVIQGCFMPVACAFLLTTFPRLFFMRSEAFKPPTVCCFVPFKTWTFASLPRAMMDTCFFFIAFMAAFMAALGAAFMAGFMAGFMAAFIAFMALAMLRA